jgi:hypothetical protein
MKVTVKSVKDRVTTRYSELSERLLIPLLSVALTAIVGINLMLLSRASTPSISLQPEVGVLSAPAQNVTDTTASGGRAVRFAAPQIGGGTSPSWNPHISCKAVVTTISTLLGTQRSALGGATYAGGGFKPGVPDRRSTAQPCSVGGQPVFVEMHRLTMGACAHIGADGDWSCELRDPSTPAPPNADPLKAMHIEIDGNMRAKGWGPTYPPGGKLVDVQGFVFWDPGHTDAAFHHYSGWELHSFTAWRLSP